MAYDLTSAAFLRDPRPMIAAMRADGAVVQVRLPLLGNVWMTTTDSAARQVLKDTQRFVRDSKAVTGKSMRQRFWYMPNFMAPLFENLINADGDDHKRLRDLVDQAFARTHIADLKPDIVRIANSLLDPLDPNRPVDLAARYARPLPLQAICRLLGVPPEDTARVTQMTSALGNVTSAVSFLKAVPGLWRTMRYFKAEFAVVRQTPRAGLISDLVHAKQSGAALSEDELIAMVVTLFLAGTETTAHLITMCIHVLTTLPEARAVLTDNPDALPLLIEEVLRFHSPVMMTQPMFVAHATELDGMALPKGAQIAPLLIAANHDPLRFIDGDVIVTDRRPNPHLGFGYGPHVCLGMQLARAEAVVAITQLFTRYPDLTLAKPNDPPRYARRIGVHGLARLDVLLKPKLRQ